VHEGAVEDCSVDGGQVGKVGDIVAEGAEVADVIGNVVTDEDEGTFAVTGEGFVYVVEYGESWCRVRWAEAGRNRRRSLCEGDEFAFAKLLAESRRIAFDVFCITKVGIFSNSEVPTTDDRSPFHTVLTRCHA